MYAHALENEVLFHLDVTSTDDGRRLKISIVAWAGGISSGAAVLLSLLIVLSLCLSVGKMKKMKLHNMTKGEM